MATIRTTLQLQDGVSPVIQHMNNAINLAIGHFERMQAASGNAVDIRGLQEARQEIMRAEISFQNLGGNINNAAREQRGFNNQIEHGNNVASGLGKKIKAFASAYLGIQTVKMGVKFVTDSISAQDVQKEAETKLKTIMQQRMGSSQDDFKEILDKASAQQRIGVIGDEVQLAGAQQVSTFLNTEEALKTLMPAMNNLAVQQHGVNVSGQDMVGIGNMVGKVMQGQISALTRVGVTFTKAQEKAMKYGNEQQRAATLAQVITNNAGKMNEAIANTPQGIIAQMKNNWGDVSEVVGQKMYPAVLNFMQTLKGYMPQASNALLGLADILIPVINWLAFYGIPAIINGITLVCSTAEQVGDFISNNWGIIGPVIGGIVAVLVLYTTALIANNTVQGISNMLKGVATLKTTILAAAQARAAGATLKQVAAQHGLNAALLACPITKIVLGIIAIIVVIYVVIGLINKITGQSISATGVICGAFNTLGGVIRNIFWGLLKIVLGVFECIYNKITAFANFFANVFRDPIGSVVKLFGNMADAVLGIIQKIASALDFVFGSHLEETVAGWRDSLNNNVETIFKNTSNGKYKETYEKINIDEIMRSFGIDPTRTNYKDAFKNGYEWGKEKEDKLGDVIKSFKDKLKGLNKKKKEPTNNPVLTGIRSDTNKTEKNTKKTADAVTASKEDLKYLRDIASQTAINRFTTAQIKVDMGGITNNVSSNMDLDSVVEHLTNRLEQELYTTAEGVHF